MLTHTIFKFIYLLLKQKEKYALFSKHFIYLYDTKYLLYGYILWKYFKLSLFETFYIFMAYNVPETIAMVIISILSLITFFTIIFSFSIFKFFFIKYFLCIYRFVIYINMDKVVTDVTANDGRWHFICFAWSSPQGNWILYKDGVEEDRGTGLAAGTYIPSKP